MTDSIVSESTVCREQSPAKRNVTDNLVAPKSGQKHAKKRVEKPAKKPTRKRGYSHEQLVGMAAVCREYKHCRRYKNIDPALFTDLPGIDGVPMFPSYTSYTSRAHTTEEPQQQQPTSPTPHDDFQDWVNWTQEHLSGIRQTIVSPSPRNADTASTTTGQDSSDGQVLHGGALYGDRAYAGGSLSSINRGFDNGTEPSHWASDTPGSQPHLPSAQPRQRAPGNASITPCTVVAPSNGSPRRYDLSKNT